MRKILLGLTAIVLLSTGCFKKDTGCDESKVIAPTSEEQAIVDYLAANSITATKHKSNMYYQIVTPGTGGSPNQCSSVLVNYTGKLTSGAQFDQGNGMAFNLQGVISGWTQGIPLIQKGGSIRLFVPPTLGYGNVDAEDENGNVIIPAGSILIFDVTLTDYQ
jgi:FKBP-type peptidyl-prolyl cis-trans isomerase FkpA